LPPHGSLKRAATNEHQDDIAPSLAQYTECADQDVSPLYLSYSDNLEKYPLVLQAELVLESRYILRAYLIAHAADCFFINSRRQDDKFPQRGSSVHLLIPTSHTIAHYDIPHLSDETHVKLRQEASLTDPVKHAPHPDGNALRLAPEESAVLRNLARIAVDDDDVWR
jgi:hypothetical protein